MANAMANGQGQLANWPVIDFPTTRMSMDPLSRGLNVFPSFVTSKYIRYMDKLCIAQTNIVHGALNRPIFYQLLGRIWLARENKCYVI